LTSGRDLIEEDMAKTMGAAEDEDESSCSKILPDLISVLTGTLEMKLSSVFSLLNFYLLIVHNAFPFAEFYNAPCKF
jgi:hypothetical protein